MDLISKCKTEVCVQVCNMVEACKAEFLNHGQIGSTVVSVCVIGEYILCQIANS